LALFIWHFLLMCASWINHFMASSKHHSVSFRDLPPFSGLSAFSVPRVTHHCSSCAWVQKQHISYCTLMISYWQPIHSYYFRGSLPLYVTNLQCQTLDLYNNF
jgi:hypothetical protein